MTDTRAKTGNPGEPMSCDAISRAAREQAMIKFADRPEYVGYWVKLKLSEFTLESVSRALGITEFAAWSLIMSERPTDPLQRRRLEASAGLEPGSLDEWLD